MRIFGSSALEWLGGILVAMLLIILGLRAALRMIWKNGNWNRD